MSDDFATRTTHHPSRSVLPRMVGCLWRQADRSATCPAGGAERRRALVTGGARGIGLETSRGLAARGAEVIAVARGETAGKQAAEAIQAEFGHDAHFAPLDLADLSTVVPLLERLEATLEAPLDVFVANAGLWPTRHALSAQGYEIAFATNVLGHHALLRGLLQRGLLAEDARIVIVTGDIYIMSSDCSADYAYRGALGGQMAYCRSKLGNLWQVRELARQHPKLRIQAVHPGVIASELGGPNTGVAGVVKRAMMLSPEQGAQTSLFCATQPDVASGAYYHNTLGRVELHPDDPAADAEKSRALVSQLDEMVSSWIPA